MVELRALCGIKFNSSLEPKKWTLSFRSTLDVHKTSKTSFKMIFSQLQKSWHLPLIRRVHKIVDIGLALLVLLLGLSFSMTMRIMFVNLWATVELVSSRMVIPRAAAFERNCLHTEWLRAVIWAHSQNILFYLVRQMSPTQKGSGYLTEEGVSFFYSIQSCWKSTQVVWRMLYISSFILNRITDSGGEGYGVKRVWRALGILNQNVDQSSFRLCEFSFPSPSQTLTEFHRILASKYFQSSFAYSAVQKTNKSLLLDSVCHTNFHFVYSIDLYPKPQKKLFSVQSSVFMSPFEPAYYTCEQWNWLLLLASWLKNFLAKAMGNPK